MKPNIGKRYTWDQVQKHWYGEQTFLAKRDGRIVCATLVAETNPEAPEVMVVGTKPRNMRRAEEFCEQGGVIPVFIKYARNEWEFKGFFRLESFTTDPARLKKHAYPREKLSRVIYLRQVTGAEDPSEEYVVPDLDEDSPSAKEGGPRWQMHLRRERDQKIIRKKKQVYRTATGGLKCEACKFDFDATYGLSEFCEVHHLIPLARDDEERTTRLEDLAVLCSNCHRAIHRLGDPMLAVPELRDRVKKRRKGRPCSDSST
jgi:predicted HNH restriction endonuclease